MKNKNVDMLSGSVTKGLLALTILFLCALRFLWVYVLSPLVPDVTFLYTVWPVGWTMSAIVLLVIYYKNLSQLKKARE